jgi:hypothetical protein
MMRGCRQVVSPGSSAVSEVSGVGVDWYGGACVGGWGGPEPRYIKQSRGVLRRECVWSFESLTLAGLGLGSRCSGGLGLSCCRLGGPLTGEHESEQYKCGNSRRPSEEALPRNFGDSSGSFHSY